RQTQQLTMFVEQNGPAQLSYKTDGGDLRSACSSLCNRLSDGFPVVPVPILRILLCPANLRGRKRHMFAGCGTHNFARAIHHYGARSTRSHVDPEHVFHGLKAASGASQCSRSTLLSRATCRPRAASETSVEPPEMEEFYAQ